MTKLLMVAVFAIAANQCLAQDPTVQELKAAAETTIKTDTSYKPDKNGWIKGGIFSISMTQVSNSNWIAAGGDEFSLSFASSLNAFANKIWSRSKWENTLDINYALINTTTLGVRKVNDRIDFVSKYGYTPKKWTKVSVAALAQFRSQLANGYEYDYFGTDEKRRNSGFFAPAYITFSPVGLDWHPSSWFSLYGSPVSARWVIASNDPYSYASPNGIFNGHVETPLATLYGVDPANPSRTEFGAFLTATLKKDIMKNVNYYSKLDLYSNYRHNPKNVDLFWTNQIKMKVNKWIQVSYTLDLLYDDDVVNPEVPANPLGLQVLSTLGVGFAARF